MNPSIGKTNIWFAISIAPTIIMLMLLIHYFPMTGLGRILTIPFTFMVNGTLVLLFLLAIRVLPSKLVIVCWLLTVMITVAFTVWVYPQDSLIPVWQQVWIHINGQDLNEFRSQHMDY